MTLLKEYSMILVPVDNTFAVATINHNSLLNTHNLTTDIDHDATTNYVSNQHIDWTSTSESLVTTGNLTCDTLNYTTLNPAIQAGGADTQVQFNDNGAFGADAGFTYDGAGTSTLGTALISPVWKPAADSTTAIQIQKANGASFVTFDTTNNDVTITTSALTGMIVSGGGIAATRSGSGALGFSASTSHTQGTASMNANAKDTFGNVQTYLASYSYNASGTIFGINKKRSVHIYAGSTPGAITAFIFEAKSTSPIVFGNNSAERMRIASNGRISVGAGATPSGIVHIKAGTTAAETAPLKFTSGTLLTTAEAGAIEFLTDDFYGTITTGAARKGFVLNDGANLTDGTFPIGTTNGRLIDSVVTDNGSEIVSERLVRTATTLYRRYYHLALASFDPGARGATWTAATANNLCGWQLNVDTEALEFQTDVHADWDAVSNLELEVKFQLLDAGSADDTVDIKVICYYMGVGDVATKTQTVEVATITDGTQYKMYKVVFPIDYDAASNVVDAGDSMCFVMNLETDTSEIDNILIVDASYNYNTTHIGIESGDT